METRELGWDDLRLFLAVARSGGLRAAASAAQLSPAALGRRMTVLERDFGRPLFDRSATGYELTAAGRDLLERAREIEGSVRALERWREGVSGERIVRVSAGPLLSEFLASVIGDIWSAGESMRIEFVTTSANLDIERRAADIDFRREQPLEPGVARRRVCTMAYALYSGRRRVNGIAAGLFVGIGGDAAHLPHARWLEAHHGDRIGVSGNDLIAVRRLVASGAGLGVLPCFAGDRDPDLVRVGPLIEELAHPLWMVTHQEERHQPSVRAVIERVSSVITRHRPLFAGGPQTPDADAERDSS